MEDVTPFEVQTITLTGRDTYANPLTANVYTLDGVYAADGSLRLMSIGQLCMAICMQRASKVETDLIQVMNEMAENSAQLQILSDVEESIAEQYEKWDPTTKEVTFTFTDAEKAETFNTLMENYHQYSSTGKSRPYTYSSSDGKISVSSTYATDFFSDVESVMDSLNSLSQELLIDMESYTAKRDDTYSLVSNLSKSFNTTLSSITNNLL